MEPVTKMHARTARTTLAGRLNSSKPATSHSTSHDMSEDRLYWIFILLMQSCEP